MLAMMIFQGVSMPALVMCQLKSVRLATAVRHHWHTADIQGVTCVCCRHFLHQQLFVAKLSPQVW